jgi:hypothetical protein
MSTSTKIETVIEKLNELSQEELIQLIGIIELKLLNAGKELRPEDYLTDSQPNT